MQTLNKLELKEIEANTFFDYCKILIEKYNYNIENVFSEITEDCYWYMLGILPPFRMIGTAFLMSEFNTRSITNGAIKIHDKYYVFTTDKSNFENCIEWFRNNKTKDLEK